MITLSPPWYTIWNKIKSTFGNDPNVKVGPLVTQSTPFKIIIDVNDHDKATAIASILSLKFDLGNNSIQVAVRDNKGSVVVPTVPTSEEQLVSIIKTALGSNAWFVDAKIVILPILERKILYAVFHKAVIQFFNDDLSDMYNNYNNVAAFVFKDVLNEAPGGYVINCSTER